MWCIEDESQVKILISPKSFFQLFCLVVGGISVTPLSAQEKPSKPNLIYVFADQWRAQVIGYMGNKDVKTPVLDKLSKHSVNFTNAVSTCPVCSPYRATLLTGQYPLTHGIFHNDTPLREGVTSIAKVYREAGYQTGYIGKWHVDGHGRFSFIPRERRQGFEFWKVLECTHDYNHSNYYGDTDSLLTWDGYDAIAQTREAVRYIGAQKKGSPFILFLSWGPPHDPYGTAPEKYRAMFTEPNKLSLRPNVPDTLQGKARDVLSKYYAHVAALDECMGEILEALKKNKLEKNTILVFTSDHGDMIYSHGLQKKQKPWDESIRVPFLLRYPEKLGEKQRTVELPISSPYIMPTLLGLSGIKIPKTVEGRDFSGFLLHTGATPDSAALIMCIVPHGQGNYRNGGREYRGIRTPGYTYVEDLKGSWLLFENNS